MYYFFHFTGAPSEDSNQPARLHIQIRVQGPKASSCRQWRLIRLCRCAGWSVWARSCENVSYAICKQQRRRSACASVQSDQHLCCLLLKQYDMYTCYIQSFTILASFCSWAGWFESYLVANPQRHIFVWCDSVFTVSTSFNRSSSAPAHLSLGTTKPTKWSVCPMKTQISLSICPIFSVCLKSVWVVLSYP